MKKLFQEKMSLNAANIDAISGYLETHAKAAGCEAKSLLRVRLAVENVLLQWMEQTTGPMLVSLVRKSTELVLEIRLPGNKWNPFGDPEIESNAQDLQSWLNRFIDDISYQYYEDVNILVAGIPRKNQSGIKTMVVAMAAGVVSGLVCKALGPDAVTLGIAIATPLYKAMMGLLVGVMGPMIFLAVMMGVARLGNPRALNDIGHKIFTNISLFMLGNMVLVGLAFGVLVPLQKAGTNIGDMGGRLFALLLQIIPANILSPFVKTDFLQIVILALAFGIALVYMHEKMQPLLDILQLAEEFFIKLMVYLCRYLPYLIYLTLFNVVLTTEVGKLLAVGNYFAGFLVVYLILILGQFLLLYFKTGISPLKLWQVSRKALMAALTTASSLVAFTELQQGCLRLGVPKNFAGLSLPLGQALYQTGTMLCFVSLAILGAAQAGLPLGIGDIIFITFTGLIMTLAVGPAGGGLAALIMLFDFLGIQEPTRGLAIVALIFLDYPSTMLNVLGNDVLCLCSASDLHKLKRDVRF
jgi:Na+/H+-dicarboxylate symporter